MNYTIYYPLPEKYISLYPKTKEKSDDAAASASESDSKDHKQEYEGAKPPLWSVVEKCMEDGSLDALREGKLNIGADGQKISGPTKEVASTEASKSKAAKKKSVQKKATDIPQKDQRSSRHIESNGKRDKHGRKDHGRERSRFDDMPAEPEGDDSDGGFFEE